MIFRLTPESGILVSPLQAGGLVLTGWGGLTGSPSRTSPSVTFCWRLLRSILGGEI